MRNLLNLSFIKVSVLVLTYLFMSTNIFGQTSNYKVEWSNEVILPYEDMGSVDLSPDATKIVFTRLQELTNYGDYGELWTANIDGTNAKPFLQSKDFGGSKISIVNPKFSPDNTKIVFTNEHGMRLHIAEIITREEYDLLDKEMEKQSPIWSPDSTKIFFYWGNPETGRGTYWIWSNITSTEAPKRFGTSDLKITSISSDGKNYFARKDQTLFILDENGNVKETRTIKTPLRGFAKPIWIPGKNYIILGNLLYDLQTGEETKFLPDEVVTISQTGKPKLIGPKALSISKDGSKIAFVMDCDCKNYIGKLKILDLTWK